MSRLADHRSMIAAVATALGEELLQQVAFVGGCTTGFLLTDEFSKEQVRHTDDVDLIVHVVGYAGISKLQQMLREQGFSHAQGEGDPICAMKLGALRVDFMPDEANALGFTNRWYAEALRTAAPYRVTDTLTIRLVQPALFLATKLEAYRDRGNDDPLESRDIEDILTLFDGRPELLDELQASSVELRRYVADRLGELMTHPDFEYAVQSAALGDAGREALLFERLDLAIGSLR